MTLSDFLSACAPAISALFIAGVLSLVWRHEMKRGGRAGKE